MLNISETVCDTDSYNNILIETRNVPFWNSIILNDLEWPHEVNATVFGRLKSISIPNFVDISILGWDITTFEKQTSAILEFYFRFRSRPFRRNRAAEFISSKSEHPLPKYDFISIFKTAAVSHVVICFGVMADHPWSAFRGLNPSSNRLFVWLIVPEILRCTDFGVLGLKLSIHALFGELLGHVFPIWRHPS